AGKALVEDHHTVPFGALALVARVAILPALGCGDAEIDDGAAILRVADFRIGAQIADENDLVDASRHCFPSRTGRCAGTARSFPWFPFAQTIRLLGRRLCANRIRPQARRERLFSLCSLAACCQAGGRLSMPASGAWSGGRPHG